MTHALVVGGATLPPRKVLARYARGARPVVAADGGADRARRAGIDVDWVVGDLDSIRPAARRAVPKGRLVEDLDVDHTDLEKCVALLVRLGASKAVLVGFLGERLDHTLGTLSVMAAAPRRLELVAVDDRFEVSLVRGSATIRAPKGTMVSLMAPGGARGVSTQGLRFPLRGADLPFSPLGTHNEVTRSPARVAVRSGSLFVLRALS